MDIEHDRPNVEKVMVMQCSLLSSWVDMKWISTTLTSCQILAVSYTNQLRRQSLFTETNLIPLSY